MKERQVFPVVRRGSWEEQHYLLTQEKYSNSALFHAGISHGKVLKEASRFQFICLVFDRGQPNGFQSSRFTVLPLKLPPDLIQEERRGVMTSLDYLNVLNGSQMSLLLNIPKCTSGTTACITPLTLFILQLTSISFFFFFLSWIEIFEKKKKVVSIVVFCQFLLPDCG